MIPDAIIISTVAQQSAVRHLAEKDDFTPGHEPKVIPDDISIAKVDPGGEEILEQTERMIQDTDMNAVPTVDPGGGGGDTGILRHAERILGRAEMMMDLAERTEVSTVELGGDAVTTESMQHTQKIMQHTRYGVRRDGYAIRRDGDAS